MARTTYRTHDPKSIKTGIDLFYPPLPKLLSAAGEQKELAKSRLTESGKDLLPRGSGHLGTRPSYRSRVDFVQCFENRLHEKAPLESSHRLEGQANVVANQRIQQQIHLTAPAKTPVSELPNKK